MRRSYHHDLPDGHVCTAADLDAIAVEAKAIAADPMIIHYNYPDVTMMRELVLMGQLYRGEWYHSQVLFSSTDEIDPEAEQLRAQIERLGHHAGIAIMYKWEPRPLRDVVQTEALERSFRLS